MYYPRAGRRRASGRGRSHARPAPRGAYNSRHARGAVAREAPYRRASSINTLCARCLMVLCVCCILIVFSPRRGYCRPIAGRAHRASPSSPRTCHIRKVELRYLTRGDKPRGALAGGALDGGLLGRHASNFAGPPSPKERPPSHDFQLDCGGASSGCAAGGCCVSRIVAGGAFPP